MSDTPPTASRVHLVVAGVSGLAVTVLEFAAVRFMAGDSDAAGEQLSRATEFACDSEPRTHWALDTWMLNFWPRNSLPL